MTLKPTIVNGQWVLAPSPKQDAAWIARTGGKTNAKV